MRVAYVTVYDARNPDAFNGIGYWIGRCMEGASLSVDYVGPLRIHRRPIIGAKIHLYHALGRDYEPYRDRLLLRPWGRELPARLADADVVLSSISPGSQPVAFVHTDRPIVIWTDNTFAAASKENRETLRRFGRRGVRAALENEAAALGRCRLAIYTSEWAARGASDAYPLDESQVHVVPLGPALEIEHGREDVARLIDDRDENVCRLLLVGTKWEGKGADIAVEAANELNHRGIRTELDIVGCRPPVGTTLPDHVHLHGFLRKSSPEGVALLRSLYARSHFLILPTRAEAFGTVIVEASAFGVPSLVTHTGGVATAVTEGRNGTLFDMEDRGETFADAVEELLADPSRYRAFALSSFAEYEERLNWAAIGRRLRDLLELAAG